MLAVSVERAAAELGRIRSTDPAARQAVLAIRLARHTLTSFWLPALAVDGDEDGDAEG